jgi:hypothetical protein
LIAVGPSSRNASGEAAANERDAGIAKKAPSRLLREQVAGEARGRLNDHGSDTIAAPCYGIAAKPGRVSTGSAPFPAVVAVLGDQIVAVPEEVARSG